MKNKQGWRKGLGLSQIMATLLVVLPTMAFIVTFIIDYWSLMQADYKLKLIANMGAEYYNSKVDITDVNEDATFLGSAGGICPNGTTLSLKSSAAGDTAGQISLTVEYLHDGPYLKNKTVTTSMLTYSYHDQNLSATLQCTK